MVFPVRGSTLGMEAEVAGLERSKQRVLKSTVVIVCCTNGTFDAEGKSSQKHFILSKHDIWG